LNATSKFSKLPIVRNLTSNKNRHESFRIHA
jgi:hypothetical protein